MQFLNSFAVRRSLHGLGMYIALVLALSIVFNQVAEKSLRTNVDEEVVHILRMAGNLDPQSYGALQAETRPCSSQVLTFQ